MSSKYSEYLNLYLQMGKKYLYLTQVLRKVLDPNPDPWHVSKRLQ